MTDAIEIIYQDLIEQSSDLIKAKLTILKEACESQVRGKSTDFSIATIGLISQDLGGVKTQTIRNKNKNSKSYKALIGAYKARYSKPVPKNIKNDEPIRLANCIEDTLTRLMVLDLIATNKKLQNELNLQKSNIMIELDHRKNSHQEDSVAIENKLNKQELNALTSFISDHKLKNLGWKLGNNGRIVDAENRPVTKPFFIDAVNKLSLVEED
jgi:hypothetical protein